MSDDILKFDPKRGVELTEDEPEIPKPADAAVAPASAPASAGPTPPAVPFRANYTADGVLEMRLDLKAAVVSEEQRHLLRGFVLNTMDDAMVMIFSQRAKLEEQRAKLNLVAAKGGNGFRKSFIDKILKH